MRFNPGCCCEIFTSPCPRPAGPLCMVIDSNMPSLDGAKVTFIKAPWINAGAYISEGEVMCGLPGDWFSHWILTAICRAGDDAVEDWSLSHEFMDFVGFLDNWWPVQPWPFKIVLSSLAPPQQSNCFRPNDDSKYVHAWFYEQECTTGTGTGTSP